jgi:hypothetical protein
MHRRRLVPSVGDTVYEVTLQVRSATTAAWSDGHKSSIGVLRVSQALSIRSKSVLAVR